MAGEDLFRKVYPGVLDIDMRLVEYLAADNLESHRWWVEVYRNMLRAKTHSQPAGWHSGFAPLTQVTQAGGRFVAESMSSPALWSSEQLNYSYRGNAFFGIGVWAVAAEYYRIAMDMAIYKRGEIGAFQNAANLGMCYLGAMDYQSAISASNDILQAALLSSRELCDFSRELVVPQAATIYCLASVALQRTSRVLDVLTLWSAVFNRCQTPDVSVRSMLRSVFDAIGDASASARLDAYWSQTCHLYAVRPDLDYSDSDYY